MGTRAYCEHCAYPISTCVCADVELVQTDIIVSILQDPHEAKHAKNTARLLPLLMPGCTIYSGTSASDFEALQEKMRTDQSMQTKNTLLIYPSKDASSISMIAKESKSLASNVEASRYSHLILLDGTWRKAKKLYLLNTWLQNIDCALISQEDGQCLGGGDYHIRKKPFEESLSTLEAAAVALLFLSAKAVELRPFKKALSSMQAHWPNKQ